MSNVKNKHLVDFGDGIMVYEYFQTHQIYTFKPQ